MLDRCEFPGKAALEALFLSPLVVPAVVIGFALLLFFALLGVFDGFTRLLAGHIIITFPCTVRTTLAGLLGIRRTLTEAAMSLGANERRAFRDITFPLARTGMIAGAVFRNRREWGPAGRGRSAPGSRRVRPVPCAIVR